MLAPQCPAGVELSISHYGARHGFDNAPIKRATDTECCYQVLEPCTGSRTELPDGQCVYPTRGRPLRENGVAVVAETTARPGWSEAITVGDSYRVVAWALREGGAPVRSIIERTLSEVHAELAVCTLSPVNVNVPVPDDRFGVLSPSAALAVRRHALSQVVVPCLSSLLATSSAPALARRKP